MWEYKVVGFHGTVDEFGEWLNKQGEQGWELCAALIETLHFVFKRPKKA